MSGSLAGQGASTTPIAFDPRVQAAARMSQDMLRDSAVDFEAKSADVAHGQVSFLIELTDGTEEVRAGNLVELREQLRLLYGQVFKTPL